MSRAKTVSNFKNLTLKDYLETASDASRRTRFITIVMLVASVLVLVSVLNSSDDGWISLRLAALRHTTSPYTLQKFPLLCECDAQVKADPQAVSRCEELKKEEDKKGAESSLWKVAEINYQLDELSTYAPAVTRLKELNRLYGLGLTQLVTTRKRLEAAKERLCKEEYGNLRSLYEAMQRTASEIKYTVRVPFFGIAFDINDIGILGGLSLWIILILLRFSLRQLIISLRIGFKEAFACDQETDFYQILASRQVFVFPKLRDPKQSARVSWGGIESLWDKTRTRKRYHDLKKSLVAWSNKFRKDLLTKANIQEAPEADALGGEDETKAFSNVARGDEWQANRNFSLRFVPKILSLAPFAIYLFQYRFDVASSDYGYDMSAYRTNWLLILGAFFLLNLLVLGIWCITKWNELDRLWDYYDVHIRLGAKLGQLTFKDGKYFDGATEVKSVVSEEDVTPNRPRPANDQDD